MSNDPEFDDLPDVGGVDDLSVFDDDPPLAFEGTDDEALKQIGRRTTPFGKVVAILMIAFAAGLVFWTYQESQAAEARSNRMEEIGQMDDQGQMLAALRTELESGDWSLDERQAMIRNLGHFRDAESVPLLITALDEPGIIRRDAAWALAEIGLPDAASAKPKLLQVLPTTDAIDKSQVVWTLALLGESGAADAIIEAFSTGRLQNMGRDPESSRQRFEARVITEVLGPERLSSETLTGHDHESVRVLTAHALAEVATSQVVEPLGRMLTAELARQGDDRSSEVIRATAAGLGRTNDARAGQPLFAMLQSEPGMRSTVVDALSSSTAAPGLAVLLGQATDEGIRRELVRILAATRDPRAADPLAGLLTDTDAEIKSTAAMALADLGDRRAVPVLFELARMVEDDTTASNAIQKLRLLATPEDSQELIGLLSDFPYRNAMILRALGATGDASVARHLEGALEGDDVRSAALALADLNHDGSYRRLLDMVDRGDVEMGAANAADRSLVNETVLASRKAAIASMGRFGREDAVEALMVVVEDQHDDYELRAMAAASIGMVANAEQLGQVLTKVNDAALDDTTRRYYMQAVWQRPHRELNSQLLDLMASQAPREVRRAGALALGYAADGANDDRLISMLEDEHTRREAAFAITLGGGDAAVARLIAVLDNDNDLKEILQQNVMNNENDWFNLLTIEMFETGAIWRRIRAAELLKTGLGDSTYSYCWAKVAAVLRSGWEGTGGANARYAREQLWAAMTGDDDAIRPAIAKLFMDLPERGLLLRARDEGGAAGDAARAVLNQRSDD